MKYQTRGTTQIAAELPLTERNPLHPKEMTPFALTRLLRGGSTEKSFFLPARKLQTTFSCLTAYTDRRLSAKLRIRVLFVIAFIINIIIIAPSFYFVKCFFEKIQISVFIDFKRYISPINTVIFRLFNTFPRLPLPDRSFGQ